MAPAAILAAIDELLERGERGDLKALSRGLPGRSIEARRRASALDRRVTVARIPIPSTIPAWLTPREGALEHKVSVKFLVRNATRIPGARRFGPRTLRFEAEGLRRFMDTFRQGA